MRSIFRLLLGRTGETSAHERDADRKDCVAEQCRGERSPSRSPASPRRCR